MIEIPSKIQGVPVTAIGLGEYGYIGAFDDKGNNISGLWIPDSVKTIGVSSSECGVFQGADFGFIRLPDGLKTITNRTFLYCSAKSINIPSSVTRICGGAFYGCSIESVTIPAGCTIVGSDSFGEACFGNSGLKTINFPAGRVYFEARPLRDYEGGIFTECDSLVNISIPKGFEAVYRSEYDFADHTLADYISGKKLSENFSAQKALKSVKVRNAAVVDHEAYLAAYNQALKSGDYTRAMLLAKQYKEYYPYYKSSEWTKRYTDIAEKTYLDEYNKAMASKDWEKAKKIINEFMGKISSDSSLSSLESKWDDMLFDVDCKMYLPAYVEKLEKKGSVVYLNSSLQFKIPLTEDVYENPRFNFTDSDGNGLWNTGYTLFLKKIKEFTGKDYQIYDSYSNPYLYRNATAEEVTKYNQVRKDAVKYFMERAVNSAVIEKDGLNSLYKIYLADDAYSYGYDSFYMTDSSGTVYTISEDDFLNYVKEVCGTEYKLNVSYYSNSSYLYRNATEAELAAYNQVRKDVVKYFMEEAVKKGTVEKDNSNLLFKIYLSDSTYSYSNSKFTVKDASGDAYTLSDKDFLSYAKEVFGTEYNLYGNYSGSYIYRNATNEEASAYHQPRKDAVKQFMEEAVKKGTVEKNDSNFVFKTNLSKDVYSYTNSTFTVKNSSGTAYTVSDKDFLSYAKEVCGTEYNLYYKYNGSYLYRNATKEETDTFYKSRKEAIKIFMDNAVKNGTINKDGSNLIFKFYLSDSIFDYHNGIFTVKDSKDKTYTLAKDDFLSSVKESCGIEYDMYWTHFSDCSFLFRNATAEEAAAYHQPKIDALKPFLDDVMKGAKFEKQGSNLLFKIYLPYLSYNYNSGSYSFKDSSGKTYTVDGTYFLSYVKEICGASYELSVNGNTNSYLYRNATDEEISAYQQPRKDAVKQFMDRALNVAVIEKDGSNFLFKIYLADDTYNSSNGLFGIIDSSGNEYILSNKDFLAYAKEVCGTEYKLQGHYYGSYLYRNATKEEIAEYHQVRKDAVKQFMERAVNVGVIEKDGSNLLFKIYLSESTYRNSKFTIKDSSGKAYTLSNDDFLGYAKETSGIDYKLSGSYRDPYHYAKANDMLQLKCVCVFQNGNLHTNLVYKLKDKWEFPVEFAESNDTVTVKSFKVKKSVFEENGLKAKDVVKKIVVSDAYGNETEIGWKDLPNVQAPSTLLITVVRGSGKKAQTYIVKVPVEWDVDEMKSIKDILDFKCILAFQNGTLHTNLACNVDGKWMYVAEFVESKGEVIIKSFRAKKSVLERVGLKTKDVIKKVVLIDDSENEIAVVNDLFEIQAPATLRFTVERGSGKKAQTMIFDVPVEWNEDEVKNLR